MKEGQRVITRHGAGVILRIDKTTYSIWVYIIRLNSGETLAQVESELQDEN